LVVVEVFAGIASGTRAIVRAGARVQQSVQVEKNAIRRAMGAQVLAGVSREAPHLLAPDAFTRSTAVLPQDVAMCSRADVEALGPVDIVMGGPPCVGWSRAGKQEGLDNAESVLLLDFLRLLLLFQEVNLEVGFLVENVEPPHSSAVLREQHREVCRILGEPVLLDAARIGSRAHRERLFWTNLIPKDLVRAAAVRWPRPELFVHEVLDPGPWEPQEVRGHEAARGVNVLAEPRRAWPTLVSYPGSHAFRDGGPGQLRSREVPGLLREPSARERERAMGLAGSETVLLAPGGVFSDPDREWEERQRRAALGAIMDGNTLAWLFCLIFSYQWPGSHCGDMSVARFPYHAPLAMGAEVRRGDEEGRPPDGEGRAAGRTTTKERVPEVVRHYAKIHAMPVRDFAQWARENTGEEEEGVVAGLGAPVKEEITSKEEATKEEGKKPTSMRDWTPTVGDAVGEMTRESIQDFVRSKGEGVFAFSSKELGCWNGEKLRIEFDDDRPVYRKAYRHHPKAKEFFQQKCTELEDGGRIEEVPRGPRDKGYASPSVVTAKKDLNGEWTDFRPCGDYRLVNGVTKKDHYRMPTADELFDAVGPGRIFSSLDLKSGYHQLPLHPDDIPKTAFWGINKQGIDTRYQWKYLPFGLKNAPSEFQRVMDQVLEGLPFARAYIDDILVYSETAEEHLKHLEMVFERLRAANLSLHPEKCAFFGERVPYLGHMVVPGGLEVQEAKVRAILEVPAPVDVARLRSFLGLANYYRRFVPNYSRVAKPLTALTRLEEPWRWGREQEDAFLALKKCMAEAPKLVRADPNRPFELHTDWSTFGMGAVLVQRDDQDQEQVIAFASRSNNKAEANYSSYEGECLAVKWAVTHFRCYLWGNSCVVITDHQPLLWLLSNDKLRGKLARWALILQEFDLTIRHRAGVTNQDADGLSRNPLPEEKLEGGALAAADLDSRAGVATYLTLPRDEECCAMCTSGPRDMWWDAAGEEKGQRLGGREELLDVAMAAMTEVMEVELEESRDPEGFQVGLPRASGPADIWADELALQVLAGVEPKHGLSQKEYDRVKHRCSRYQWLDAEAGVLQRVWPQLGRSPKVVPPPSRRVAIIMALHQQLGHFGVRRTAALVRLSYWWTGLFQQVAAVLRSCKECDRVRATFNAPQPVLHPLPIQGLGYRWSVDLAGPLPVTPRGAKYVMVMVENFSKWVVLAALPNKNSEVVAQVFVERVLAPWGAPAVVLTDQGKEFQGEFEKVCYKALVDHRTTSRDHPECDGLAERTVQTVKSALRKFDLDSASHKDWDLQLPWLTMGYNFSRQASLSAFSPYELVYGREPVLQGSLRQGEELKVLDGLDRPEVWMASVAARAVAFQRTMPLAMRNLAIAQQRDTRRYAQVRGGGYRPRIRRYEVGDYVYLQQTAPTTLDVTAGRIVLRVTEVGPTGVLTLVGSDGVETKDNARNVTLCHLPNLDPVIDPLTAAIPAGYKCMACGDPRRPATMILCDVCSRGWHLECLTPPLKAIPADWQCVRCRRT
jgi:site-specific DNA-cytosine methylase